MKRAAALLALALAVRAALAADMPAASVEIVGAVPLAGLGIERQLLPYPVQTASAADLRQADNLTDYLARRLAGVNVSEVSGSPFQNDLSFRGFRASPVLGTAQGISVYLDGVRVNEAFGDVVNWDMIPEAALSNVLMVPGSNPVYGLNTLGGALALSTYSGRSHPGVSLDASVSAAGRRRADLAAGRRGDDGWHSFAAATLFDDQGWRDHSGGRLGNLLAKIGRDGDSTDWNLTLLAGRSAVRGNGLLPAYEGSLYEKRREAVYTHPDITRNRLAQLMASVTRHLDARADLSATLYVRNSRRDTVSGDISAAFADQVAECDEACDDTPVQAVLNSTSTRQRGRGASIALSIERGAHHIDAGATVDRSRVWYVQTARDAAFSADRGVSALADAVPSTEAAVDGSSFNAGVYVADTWTLSGATHLTASGRFSRARVENRLNERPAERFTYTSLNPSLGITHRIGGLTLFANAAQGNRVPTVIELGCADRAEPCRLPVGLQADPFLEQVVARTMEAGARWHGGTVSLYRTVNRNDILFVSAGVSQQGYFTNVTRTRHQGMDANLSWHWDELALHGAYSYLDAAYDAPADLFAGERSVHIERGTRIAGLPRHTFKLGADWKAGQGWTLGADLRALSGITSQGNEDGQVVNAGVGGYALVDLRAAWQAGGWELYARIGNLFGRRYETFGAVARDMFPDGHLATPSEGAAMVRFVAPGAPRSVLAGLRYRF